MAGTCPPGRDSDDLADTLRAIARDPRDIARRGTAAARFMGPRNATDYADKLATFLYAGQARLMRRAAMTRDRSPRPDPQDQIWHTTYVQVRGLMSGRADRTRAAATRSLVLS